MINIDFVEEKIGYNFINKDLLIRALTHSSYGNVHNLQSYERLEFLGDSLLGFFVAEKLLEKYPKSDQGQLTKMRQSIVSKEPLCEVIMSTGLSEQVLFEKNNKEKKLSEKNISDIFESILAAVYIDGGFEKARQVCLFLLDKAISNANIEAKEKSSKSMLFEKFGQDRIEFKTLGKTGPDNSPEFEIGLYVDGELVASNKAPNKKKAENACSEIYLSSLK